MNNDKNSTKSLRILRSEKSELLAALKDVFFSAGMSLLY